MTITVYSGDLLHRLQQIHTQVIETQVKHCFTLQCIKSVHVRRSWQVISYLFAQKVLAPSKFVLIRGNHEIRDIQKMFTFHRFVEVNIGITNIKSLSLLRRSLGSKPGKEHTRIRGEVLKKLWCCDGGRV